MVGPRTSLSYNKHNVDEYGAKKGEAHDVD